MSKQSKANKGRSGAVRQKALKAADLANMERHGKREDESGQRRQVREAAPLVYGSLDIRDACAAHMDGVQRSKGTKTECLHALVQFPTKLIDGAGKQQQQQMLDHAVRFVNEFHGGNAVFAARLDRDEKGRHSVDVFAMPRYDFQYKDGRTVLKASVSKFSKEQARKRLHKRDKKTGELILDSKGQMIGRDDRRAQGSALQDAWFEYMRDEMGLEVEAPERKKATTADRLEPEVHGLREDRRKLLLSMRKHHDELHRNAMSLRDARIDLKAERASFEADVAKHEKEMAGREKRADIALAAAQRVAEARGDTSASHVVAQHRRALRRPKRGDDPR